MTLRESSTWCVNRDLRLADWKEGDAVAYIVGLGDLHVLSGLSLSIVQALMERSLSFCELAKTLEALICQDQDPHLLSRQLFQLQTLHLVSECR
ncbi:MAG: hypothetical protein CL693_02045 [Cellvibrionaceae bacterium]|nr:hypothetical protein [Cellvibrionaceae bacterium]